MTESQLIVGHGIDMIDIDDFAKLLAGVARDSLDRYFTVNELTAAGDGEVRAARLAGRFAVKEAVLKALGIGWGNGIAFPDVEVVTLESGEPAVRLKRGLAEIASRKAIQRWLVSTSHTRNIAMASVIALSSSKVGPRRVGTPNLEQ